MSAKSARSPAPPAATNGNLCVGVDLARGVVLLDFTQPLREIALSVAAARSVANALLTAATELERRTMN